MFVLEGVVTPFSVFYFFLRGFVTLILFVLEGGVTLFFVCSGRGSVSPYSVCSRGVVFLDAHS